MRTSFLQAYKGIRNRLRKLHPESVVLTILKQLHTPTNSKFDDLKRIPWHLLLIVKWTCQDSMAGKQSKELATHMDIDELKQTIWDLPENTSKTDLEKTPIRLFMRRVLRVQAAFQKGATLGAFRESAILMNQQSNSSLVKMFTKETGLTPQEYLDFTILAYAAVSTGNQSLHPDYFKQLLNLYDSDKLIAYLDCMSADFAKLTKYVRSLPDANKKVYSEIFEFPVLSRYPFYKHQNMYLCWHPAVFMRGAEGLVHAALSKYGQAYIDRYSRAFEKHIVATTRHCVQEFLDETEISKLLPKNSKVVDGLISFAGMNIYVEVKAGLYNESLMTSGERRTFAHKTKSLITAIHQAWEVSSNLRVEKKAPDQILNSESEFLLIVTNRELTAGTGKKLSQIYPEETLQTPDSSVSDRLPLENIYVVSVEDFERLIMSAKNNDIDLPKFLNKCKVHDSKPDTMVFYMQQHLEQSKLPNYVSHIVDECYKTAFARIEHVFKRTS